MRGEGWGVREVRVLCCVIPYERPGLGNRAVISHGVCAQVQYWMDFCKPAVHMMRNGFLILCGFVP